MKYVLTFGSTHKVLKAESILKARRLVFRLDPAPKVLATYCDLVITIEEDGLATAKEVLGGAGSSPKAVYKKEGEGYVKV